jgi:hypothetical protein
MRLSLATGLVIFVLPLTINAQSVRIDALSLQPGARARILAPATDARYTLIKVGSTSADTLRYSLDREVDTKSISWQRIAKMDASAGRHSNVLRGIGIGFLLGVVGGAILGASIEPGQDFNKGMDAAIAAGYFGFVGAVSGGVVGLGWRSESWIPVAIPKATIPR